MTARPHLGTLEAVTEESLESTSPSSEDENGSSPFAHDSAKVSEASISRTLQAILSKADDDELLLDQSPSATAHSDHPDAAGPSIDMDTAFDDDETLNTSALPSSLARAHDDQVGGLLDEVAQALNVQATESRNAAMGRPTPSMMAAEKGPLTPVVAKTAEEFEFEDPDDGPTTLNANEKGEIELLKAASAARDQDDEREQEQEDEEEEAVVLGPAVRAERKSGFQSTLAMPGSSGRTVVPAPPMPGSAATPVVNEGTRTTRETPFAGLPVATLPTFPAPNSARTRLPTPVPGQAIGVPGPRSVSGGPSSPFAAADGSALPTGTPDASSRRTVARIVTPPSTTSLSDATIRTSIPEEPVVAPMSGASKMLKKDVRFRMASFAAIVLVTFAGGLLIGRAAMKGGGDATAQPAGIVTSPTAPVAAPVAAQKPSMAAPGATAPAAAKTEPVAAVQPTNDLAAAGSGSMQFDAQPIHKRRARRATAKEDLGFASAPPPPPAPKGPVRVASTMPATKSSAPVAASTKSGGKKKSVWHDPFAD